MLSEHRDISAEIPDSKQVEALLRETVERILLPRFGKLEQSEIHKKGDDSLVTEVDLAAERFLSSNLSTLVAGSRVLGEEAIANDSSRLQTFISEHSKSPYWLVDPLDGTRNFVKGSEVFCSMIALVLDEQVRASWLYSHQDRSIFHAIEGVGAFVDNRPLAPIAVPTTAVPTIAVPTTTAPGSKPRGRISWTRQPVAYDTERLERLTSIRCAGQDFVDLACGRIDFAYYNKLWPWDHAPGGFLLRTLGGRLGDFATDRTYLPYERAGPILSVRESLRWQDFCGYLGRERLGSG